LEMLTGNGLLPPIRLSSREARTALQPAPVLGQHNVTLLADLGYDPADLEELCRQGAI
jgi:crotonobetainyl-CoA:carnitine CoA-transferase CaiB-like acyl-CoA transferase